MLFKPQETMIFSIFHISYKAICIYVCVCVCIKHSNKVKVSFISHQKYVIPQLP